MNAIIVWLKEQLLDNELFSLIADVSDAVKSLVFPHGNSYVCVYAATKDTGEAIVIAFKTPDTSTRIRALVTGRGSGEAHLEVLEGATVVDDSGSALPVFNRERNSENVSSVIDTSQNPDAKGSAMADPTISDDGEMIYEDHFGAGNNTGGQSRDERVFVLMQDTQYAYRLTSEANNNDIQLIVNWCEA